MSDRYTLRIAKTAEKDLLELQAKQFKQVVSKILCLQGTPRPQDCKAFFLLPSNGTRLLSRNSAIDIVICLDVLLPISD